MASTRRSPQQEIDTRALELASGAMAKQESHDRQDEGVHQQMIVRLNRQDDAADTRAKEQNAARTELRNELIGYLGKLSDRQWKGLAAIVSLLIAVLVGIIGLIGVMIQRLH